ncbi:MAG: membrane dipeptidase, partial [Chloroflexi bacterium]|nr:membrane dipeptidase [Chloroflexota bacterium]
PDYQDARVAIIFATLFASPTRHKEGAWDSQCYADSNEAHKLYSRQADAYHRLIDDHPEKFRLLCDQSEVISHLQDWEDESAAPPVGLVILMECADSIRSPSELELWWQRGVRIIGPAWAGTRFCGGTGEPGPLTKDGYALLEAMADLGFALDLSHMDEKAVLQSLDFFSGPILATHSNSAALMKGADTNRHLTDRVIQGAIERDAIIGVVPYNPFLLPGWTLKDGREHVSLKQVVAHIDHICQIAGDAHHVGIGSDFDGGFGLQHTPIEINTIADLHKLVPLLDKKGYNTADIAAIFGQNWHRFLTKNLP